MEQLRQIYGKFQKPVAFEDQQALTNDVSAYVMYSKS